MTTTAPVRLRIDSLAFGGEGVGRVADETGGRVVFVAGAAPGDLVEVAVSFGKKDRWARGELVRVVEPGERVEAPCRYHERCGGCPWQHVAAAAQQAAKQALVVRALAKLPGIVVEPLVPAPQPWGYRTRARLTVRGERFGFHGRRSHEIVDVTECIALVPALDRALQRVRALGLPTETVVAGLVAPAPDETVHLQITADALDAATERAVAALVYEHIEHILGIELVLGGRSKKIGAFGLDIDGWQAEAGGFAQANWAQNRWLVTHVARAVGEVAPTRVLELYAGAGNFTGALLDACPSGVAVEGAPPAARALTARIARHRHHAGWQVRTEPDARTAGWLSGQASSFAVALLDPPRAGAKELVHALAGVRQRIVYVSCDPMTLARDLTVLAEAGFTTGRAWPVDMMPQTAHIEVLCVVDRAVDRVG